MLIPATEWVLMLLLTLGLYASVQFFFYTINSSNTELYIHNLFILDYFPIILIVSIIILTKFAFSRIHIKHKLIRFQNISIFLVSLVFLILGMIISAVDSQKKSACIESGGDVQSMYIGKWFCNPITSDYGKECQDGSECEGYCVATSTSDLLNDNQTGKCSTNKDMHSCVEYIENGRMRLRCSD